jgi:hypothetical protein
MPGLATILFISCIFPDCGKSSDLHGERRSPVKPLTQSSTGKIFISPAEFELRKKQVEHLSSQGKYAEAAKIQENLLRFIQQKFGNSSVRISAQSYLLKFYESFGFRSIGKEYLEDNIPHMEMLLKKED